MNNRVNNRGLIKDKIHGGYSSITSANRFPLLAASPSQCEPASWLRQLCLHASGLCVCVCVYASAY